MAHRYRYGYSYDYDRRGTSTNWAFGLATEPLADDIAVAIPGLQFVVYCDVNVLTVSTERALTAGEQTTLDGLVSTIQAAG